MSHRTESQTVSASLGLLVLRAVVGVTFIVHGWQKLKTWGIESVEANFVQAGVPVAEVMAPVVTYVELFGGIALVLGLLSRLAGLLLFIDMLGAIGFVHASNGFFVSEGGVELVLLLAAGSFAIAVIGPGLLAVGGVLSSRGRAGLVA